MTHQPAGQRQGPARALQSLEELYGGQPRRGATTLLLLDEIDMLITRDQQILYNLFEWPTRAHARSVVVYRSSRLLALLIVAATLAGAVLLSCAGVRHCCMCCHLLLWSNGCPRTLSSLSHHHLSAQLCPLLPHRLAVIGIANTHDIDERVLPRIASRLGSSKLAFVPYQAEQIKTIAADRLQAVGHQALVDPTAVDFAARKVRPCAWPVPGLAGWLAG